jgi:hypothetical protein
MGFECCSYPIARLVARLISIQKPCPAQLRGAVLRLSQEQAKTVSLAQNTHKWAYTRNGRFASNCSRNISYRNSVTKKRRIALRAVVARPVEDLVDLQHNTQHEKVAQHS